MVKKVTRVFLALLFVMGLAVTTHTAQVSAASGSTVSVHGKLTEYASGNPVSGARVQVSCNGTLVATSAPTDSGGNYVINVPADRCPTGGDLLITVTTDTLTGTAISTIKDDNEINIPLQKNVNIPEYGLTGALTAGSAAVGAIAFVRHRSKQGAQL